MSLRTVDDADCRVLEIKATDSESGIPTALLIQKDFLSPVEAGSCGLIYTCVFAAGLAPNPTGSFNWIVCDVPMEIPPLLSTLMAGADVSGTNNWLGGVACCA